ncbi:hypothetical protein [Nocardioides sp. WS12]|uniref:hypothetical protein n=1 Tax=Nocardioides sp. WS12 TaxID=2486272 RepID=UPI0015FC4C16|nr:hypothetical protein [Nocardioides sp. WS12]
MAGLFLLAWVYVSFSRILDGQILLGLALMALLALTVTASPLIDLAERHAPWGERALQAAFVGALIVALYAAAREWSSFI